MIMNKITKKTALNTRNSKILHETMVTLGALKEGSDALSEMEINEMQVHLLDEDGDGVGLCLEYDERTGELKKTFHTMDEYYTDDEDEEEEETDDELMVALEDTTGDYDPCISPENVKEVLDTMIEKTISEEYDEVFQEYDKDGKPPLLN